MRTELGRDDALELRHQPFLDPLVKEGEIVVTFLEQRLESELQEPFRQRRIVGEVGERDLRLDHPELGEVAAGVRVLGPERRPEGVDLGKREAVGLDVELPRHRQERLAAKEILREIDLALRRAWQVGEIERGDPEQLPRPLCVHLVGQQASSSPEPSTRHRRPSPPMTQCP